MCVRPAPDGMAYLSVLGPLKDVVGAYAAVQARSRAVVAGACPEELPAGRGVGAVAADTALAVLSGRAVGQLQPVEVHLVMTDRALLGTGEPGRSVFEPARIPGHGSVPALLARAWLREGLNRTNGTILGGTEPPPAEPPGAVERAASPARRSVPAAAQVWLRRLYTGPDGRDLVAMDSRRRVFGGLLRRMLVLRDDVCTTPWCEAPIVHADHTTPIRLDGRTTFHEGAGTCARCNQTKEAPGWRHRVTVREAQRVVEVRSPLGHHYVSEPPPLLGWGSDHPAPAVRTETASTIGASPAPPTRGGSTRQVGHVHRRKRPLFDQEPCRTHPSAGPDDDPG